MRWSSLIGSAALAVGLLTGCGGAEAESPHGAEPSENQPVEAQSACTDACELQFRQCRAMAENAHEMRLCALEREICLSPCPTLAGSEQVGQ